MLAALAEAFDARDPGVDRHCVRVSALAETLARRLGCDRTSLDALRVGARLHDLGKLVLSQQVLSKPGPLEPAELAQVRLHPVIGARLVAEIRGARNALPCVLFHHERWDGGGYPLGRAGPTIPLTARILAVADAFDAMTSTRPYRRALSTEQALAEIGRCAGTQFDPVVAKVFLAGCDAGARAAAG